MSPGGVWAGKPIYVSRNDYFSFTLLGISAFMILKHAVALDTLHTIICILVSYFWYDLYSGILHVVLDEPANISLPLIGQPCLEFQWHHFIPSDIAREHFLDVAGDLNIAISIMRKCIKNRYIWIAIFLFVSAFDVIILGTTV